MPFFQSITSLFSGNSASSSRHTARGRSVMTSTNDAFSLPTTSSIRYGDGPGKLTDVHHTPSAASSPGPSRRNSSHTSYPPQKDTYRPAMSYFPPLSHTFHRLRNALAESFPELLETINPPINPTMIAAFEQELGCPLPPPVRDSFLVADGQDREACNNIQGFGGIFYGLHLLSFDEVVREWSYWRQVELDQSTGSNPAVLATMASIPPRWIKRLYASRGWLPLLSDRTGNYVGVDLDPGPGGSWGQVIVFGRDFDRKCVLWRGEGEGGWGKWFAGFVDELESGEGWEADKSNSSDEEEEIGYSSYNGGQTYGEAGRGFRLTGEYRGWGVLEAWWDKSVRKWEGLGLGLDVEEVERGLSEARRINRFKGKAKEDENSSLELEISAGDNGADPGSSNASQTPPTPIPGDVEVLLPPSSPGISSVPKIQQPVPSPIRVITPLMSTNDHPLKTDTGLLSPPSHSPPRAQRRPQPPAPTALDLPTRADVQAAQAVARAEASGLRGGWVMNLNSGTRFARGLADSSNSFDSEMVDIDLESGRRDRFGQGMTTEDHDSQQLEERLSMAGIEQRRGSHSPQFLNPSRTSSPLSVSRDASFDIPNLNAPSGPASADGTPRAVSRDPLPLPSVTSPSIPSSIIAASSAIRRPPRVAVYPDSMGRPNSPIDHRASIGRTQRESSVVSTDSRDGLLEFPRSAMSPAPRTQSPDNVPEELLADHAGLEDQLDEIHLDG